MKYYAVKCRNCRYSRAYGNAPLTADTKAAAHSLRKMHTTDVIVSDLITLTNSVGATYDHSESRPALLKVTEENSPSSACRAADPPF